MHVVGCIEAGWGFNYVECIGVCLVANGGVVRKPWLKCVCVGKMKAAVLVSKSVSPNTT